MVNIFVYGLDQFVVGNISLDVTSDLAKLLEVEEDEINFVATNAMVFHKGVEQTSWQAIIEVQLPEECRYEQDNVAKLLRHYIDENAIHVYFRFVYINKRETKEEVNDDYPRYLTEENQVDFSFDEDNEEREEGDGDDDIYTGDIFADVFKK